MVGRLDVLKCWLADADGGAVLRVGLLGRMVLLLLLRVYCDGPSGVVGTDCCWEFGLLLGSSADQVAAATLTRGDEMRMETLSRSGDASGEQKRGGCDCGVGDAVTAGRTSKGRLPLDVEPRLVVVVARAGMPWSCRSRSSACLLVLVSLIPCTERSGSVQSCSKRLESSLGTRVRASCGCGR